jgi:hypothetical protein
MKLNTQVIKNIKQLLILKKKKHDILESKLNKLNKEREYLNHQILIINEKRFGLKADNISQQKLFYRQVIGKVTSTTEVTNLEFALKKIKQKDIKLSEQIDITRGRVVDLDVEISQVREEIKVLCKTQEKYTFVQSAGVP